VQGVTLVVYMGIASVDALQNGLLHALSGDTRAASVQHASLPQQRQFVCRLDELCETVATRRIVSPANFVIGDLARGTRLAADRMAVGSAAPLAASESGRASGRLQRSGL